MPLEISKPIQAKVWSCSPDKIELVLRASMAKSDEFASLAGKNIVFTCDGLNTPVIVPIKNGIAQETITIPSTQYENIKPIIHYTAKFDGNGDEVSGEITMPNVSQQPVLKILMLEILYFTPLILAAVLRPEKKFVMIFTGGYTFLILGVVSWIMVKYLKKIDLMQMLTYNCLNMVGTGILLVIWMFFN